MKKISAALIALVLSVQFVSADSSSKRTYSDVNYSTFKTTWIASRTGGFGEASISSGNVAVPMVFVSSPGINSKLSLYDNRLAGATSNQIDSPLTSTYGVIPLGVETVNGLVVISTCATCSSAWAQPDLRITYRRIR